MSCEKSHCKKKKCTTYILIIFSLVLVLSLLVGLVFYLVNRDPYPATGWYDPKAKIGDISGKTKEEIESDLNSLVEEGMFHIHIASVVNFKDGKSEGEVRIQNISGNPYNMTVKITLDKSGETVYESKGIAPGQYIQYIPLDINLKKGTYEATAVFTAYATGDLLFVGQVQAKIKLVIEN